MCEMKTTMCEMKSRLDEIKSRLDFTEEKISKLDTVIETKQRQNQGENKQL